VEDEGAADIVVISRSGENHYGNLSLHRDAQVIVNTNPVGMIPDNAKSPDTGTLPLREGWLDVSITPAYGPGAGTEALGNPAPAGGLAMLVSGAAAQSVLRAGGPHAERSMLLALQRSQKTLYEGMPGSARAAWVGVASLLAGIYEPTLWGNETPALSIPVSF
jgi:shikimate 5-dehydrogenase